MHYRRFSRGGLFVALFLSLSVVSAAGCAQQHLDNAGGKPEIRKIGETRQLFVLGHPFLILGGELSNSAASDPGSLEGLWGRLSGMCVNTVLVPVTWEQIEPEKGKFNFRDIDSLVAGARRAGLHLVILWFGSWKNSMSTYDPVWVKLHPESYPLVQLPTGSSTDILSAFSNRNQQADAAAFRALMSHLRRVDGSRHTVLMVQVENEVGMLGAAREHGRAADAKYREQVPGMLMQYLATHRSSLSAWLRDRWTRAGGRTSGSWAQVFGEGRGTNEIFTAWWDARYVNAVAAAGESAYGLPLYVNAALLRPERAPNQRPSGGPIPRLLDVWHAAAPTLTFFAPDIYFDDFGTILNKYHVPWNTVFVPETNSVEQGRLAANSLYAFGEEDAIGFSPFAIDLLAQSAKSRREVRQAYCGLAHLAPKILRAQETGKIVGFQVKMNYYGDVDRAPQRVALGPFIFKVKYDTDDKDTANGRSPVSRFGGLLIALGGGNFLVAGRGFTLTPHVQTSGAANAGILVDWQIRESKQGWSRGRLLNGDATVEGRVIRLPPDRFSIQRFSLYRYN